MDRRAFFKNSALLAGGTAVFPALLAAEENDFVVREFSRDADSLEQLLLDEGKEAIVQEITLETCRLPSIIYIIHIKAGVMGREEEGPCVVDYDNPGGGSCAILNNEGYFLTAYHVLDDLVTKHNIIAIFYDPSSGIIRKPRILSYSEEFDIALGKIDAPEDFRIEPHHITQKKAEQENMLYAVRNDPRIFFSKRFRVKVERASGYYTTVTDGSYKGYTVTQKRLLVKDAQSLGTDLFRGFAMSLVKQDKEVHTEEGTFFMRGKIRRGDSGLPVFNMRNGLVGIMINTIPDFFDGGDDLLYCTAPDKIRALINNYIHVCGKSK